MGLYMNINNHPDVYRNEEDIRAPNQSYYEYNVFSEMINEQKKINDSLHRTFQQVSQMHMNESHAHATRWEEVNQKLYQLNDGNKQRQLFENQIMNQLTILQEKDQQLKQILEHEKNLKQDLINRFNEISMTNQSIFDQLSQHESLEQQQTEQISGIREGQDQLLGQMTKQSGYQEQLMDKMTKQEDHQEQLMDQMKKQTHFQDDVLNKLDSQEALIEKALRQLNHFRSIIYERSSFLAEKIEESYDLTSAYIYNYLTSSDQPLTLYLANQQKQQNEKKTRE